MTSTAPAPAPAPEHIGPPHFATAKEAVQANAEAASHTLERAEAIRQAPDQHKPKLVLSQHVRGTSVLDKIADGVNVFCGSMYVFIGITVGIVLWLILGQVAGFDPVPWPLLLTILNLPQLSIMISLQVSANRAQTASDRRALADHDTLIALHEMSKTQLQILEGQDRILGMLQNFAAKDMPGRQQELLQCAQEILASVSPNSASGQQS
jgi:uncharacterized membrane protein